MTGLQKDISEQRRVNRQKVYETLYFSTNLKTKKELAMELGLSLPTINQNVSELCNVGIIKESKSTNFTGGRHACVLEVCENAFFSIGISITDVNIRFILTNLKLHEIAYKKISYTTKSFQNEIAELLSNELDLFINETKIDKTKILGVGIAVPALIDHEKQEIKISPTLKIKNMPYKYLTDKINYRTFVENDGTAGGFCEYFFSQKTENMAYISLENGVGGAIIIAGEQYLGDNIKAAEFGHICVENGGLPCSCGKKGCLEAYCNAARFSENLGISLEEFAKELKSGNKKYQKMLKDMLKHLAIAIANTRITLDCNVVLGGFLLPIIAPYFDKLKEFVANEQYGDDDVSFLSLCKFGNKSVCMGMALKYIKDFINLI